jgi:hypothetical protein
MISTSYLIHGSFAASSSNPDDVLTSACFATLPACHRGGQGATNLWSSLFFLAAGGQTLSQSLHDVDRRHRQFPDKKLTGPWSGLYP